ncbi:MAG: hypothetical protein K1X94_08630 [Sandaracinaceae bacterium]|nr:hypothetical protein [Sandaracinaceae bacterium]
MTTRTAFVALSCLAIASCGGRDAPPDASTGIDAASSDDASRADDAPPSTDASLPDDVRRTPLGPDARYCELLLAYPSTSVVRVEVWGTQGLSDCPMAEWEAIDATAVRASTGAALVIRNGPRHWLPDRTTAELPDRSPMYFGALLFQQLASIELPAGTTTSAPYTERTILRNAHFEIDAGREVYELLAPDGSIYVMQAYAQIVDPALSSGDLPGLGTRLSLPVGWSYRARTLDATLVLDTPGMATVLQDELQNSYSRYVDGGP